MIRREFDYEDWVSKVFKTIIIKGPWDYWFIITTNPSQTNHKP